MCVCVCVYTYIYIYVFLLFVRYKTYNTIPRLTASKQQEHIFLLFVRHKSWYSVVSLRRCSLFPSRVGLRTYQHPGRKSKEILCPNKDTLPAYVRTMRLVAISSTKCKNYSALPHIHMYSYNSTSYMTSTFL